MDMKRSILPFVGVLLLALALAMAACGGDKKAPTASPSPAASASAEATATTAASPTSTATPVPEVIDNVEVKPLTTGEPVDLPKGVVFYVISQCQACDVPPVGVDRVWRDLGGTVHTDRIFTKPDDGYITSVAVSPSGQSVVIGVCTIANCGPMGETSPNGKVTFHASADTGVTWKAIGSVAMSGLVMTAKDGPGGPYATVRHTYKAAAGDWRTEYLTMPGSTVIEHSLTLDPGATTFALGSNVVYRGPDRTSLWLIQGASAPWVNPKLPPTADVQSAMQFEGTADYRWGIAWVQDGPGGNPAPRYFGLMPQREGTPPRIFKAERDGPGFIWAGGLTDRSALALNAYLPGSALGVTPAPQGMQNVPAILDLDTGQIHAIRELVARAITPTATSIGDASRIVATARGHFIAVKGAGDCLNLRLQPSRSAEVLNCFRDGTILDHLGESTQADGVTWAHVSTLDGWQGWASLEFLDVGAGGAAITGTQPVGVRSGDAAIDRVLDALASGDRARIIALMEWTIVGCVAQPQGIGSPPKCPDDVPAGSKMETLPGSCGEGFYTLKDQLTANTEFSLFKPQPLYAVFRKKVTNDGWASYDTVAEYGTPGGFAIQVFIREGHITGFSGCRQVAEDVKNVPAGDFIIAPR